MRAALSSASKNRKEQVAQSFNQTLGGQLQGRPKGQLPATPKLFPAKGGAAAPPCASVGPPLGTATKAF